MVGTWRLFYITHVREDYLVQWLRGCYIIKCVQRLKMYKKPFHLGVAEWFDAKTCFPQNHILECAIFYSNFKSQIM